MTECSGIFEVISVVFIHLFFFFKHSNILEDILEEKKLLALKFSYKFQDTNANLEKSKLTNSHQVNVSILPHQFTSLLTYEAKTLSNHQKNSDFPFFPHT